MLNQLYLTTFLVVIPIAFFLLTSMTVRKNLNLISPRLEDRIENSKLFIESIAKTVITLFILLFLYVLFMIYVVLTTSQLIMFVFVGIIVLLTLLSMSLVFIRVYPKISDFELRVSQIPSINYTSEQEKIFSNVQKNILIYSILGVLSNFVVAIGDSVFLKTSNLTVSTVLLLVALSTLPVFSLLIANEIDKIDNKILKEQTGYLGTDKLNEFKKEIKETTDTAMTIKDLRNAKIKEIKNKKVKEK